MAGFGFRTQGLHQPVQLTTSQLMQTSPSHFAAAGDAFSRRPDKQEPDLCMLPDCTMWQQMLV